MGRTHGIHVGADTGFTLVELMVVVLIIGILIATAMPVYFSARARSAERACFDNQRTLEVAVQAWVSCDPDRRASDVAGLVDAANPIVIDHIVGRAPTCPSAPHPADSDNPTLAEGAYTLDNDGNVGPCGFGDMGAHDTYQ